MGRKAVEKLCQTEGAVRDCIGISWSRVSSLAPWGAVCIAFLRSTRDYISPKILHAGFNAETRGGSRNHCLQDPYVFVVFGPPSFFLSLGALKCICSDEKVCANPCRQHSEALKLENPSLINPEQPYSTSSQCLVTSLLETLGIMEGGICEFPPQELEGDAVVTTTGIYRSYFLVLHYVPEAEAALELSRIPACL